jgi:hypothetical protein
LHPTHIGESLG